MTEQQNGFHVQSNGDSHDDYLFDPDLLQSTFDKYALENSKLVKNLYNERFLIRPLKISDYNYEYIDLLRQLTECGTIENDEFQKRFNEMKQCLNTYFIIVIEDLNNNRQIVGSATLIVEKKFIRQLAVRGRIEDVVVDSRCRGQQLGKILLEILTAFGRDYCQCYKISLECRDPLVSFYQQFGYKHEDKQNYLCKRYIN